MSLKQDTVIAKSLRSLPKLKCRMDDFEMRETFVCPYHFPSLSSPFPDSVATNVAGSTFLVDSPDHFQTSLSICKCSHTRIDKENNLTTIQMDPFPLSKSLKCVKALKQNTDHRNNLASRAEVTKRFLSQQLLRTGLSICPIGNSFECNVQSAN